MDYAEFREEIPKRVKDVLSETVPNLRVDVQPIRKNNGILMDALIMHGEERTGTCVYLNWIFEQHQNGKTTEVLAEELAGLYRNREDKAADLKRLFIPYERAKENLTVGLCNAEMNEELLKTIPHEIREDLALFYRILLKQPDGEIESALITNPLLEYWGIGEQALQEDAWDNMRRKNSPRFCRMDEILQELMYPDVAPAESETEVPLYVLTNREKVWGAAYMFDEDTMAGIAKELGSSFIVFPSSIHEVLILPEERGLDVEEMQEIVRTVNMTVVDSQEVLSNQVYRYDREGQKLSIMHPPEQTQGMEMNL